MSESMNALPVQTYVRSRVSTVVQNVAGLSSGSVALNLDKPSDLTVIVISDTYEFAPLFFTVAIGRVPTMMDFDIVLSPIDSTQVKPPTKVTLHLPAMQSTLYWSSFDGSGDPEAFGGNTISRLVMAIDQ